MSLEDLITRARVYGTEAHRRINQLRKYTKHPYDVHLSSVASIVREVSDDPEMIAAAWLHDVVEDTPATFEDIEREFGRPVRELVEQLTDVSLPSTGNRARRALLNREHTARASQRAKTIKLADLIDNARDICKNDPRFAVTYLEEMAALLEVLTEGDAALLKKARNVLARCSEKLGLGKSRGSVEDASGQPDLVQGLSVRYPKAVRNFARAFTADDLSEPLPDDWGTLEASRELKAGQMIAWNAPLSDVVEVLTRYENCFVSRDGKVEGVITRADIQKPIARMWLFGMITVVELFLTDHIRSLWPDESWKAFLSPSRLKAAQSLQSERLRRGQACTLLDCLQIGDKGKILLRNPEQLASFGFESKRAGETVMNELGSLRNNLAHAQDIVSNDWSQIVRLARRLEALVE